MASQQNLSSLFNTKRSRTEYEEDCKRTMAEDEKLIAEEKAKQELRDAKRVLRELEIERSKRPVGRPRKEGSNG